MVCFKKINGWKVAAAELSNAARLVLDELATERLVAASSKVLHHLHYVPTAGGLLILVPFKISDR